MAISRHVAADQPRLHISHISWRRVALSCAVLTASACGVVGGACTGGGAASLQGQQELMTLLRFMAAIKMGIALLSTALVWWRIGSWTGAWLVPAGIVACTLMALAPGIIWSGANVAIGAALFHAGFLTILMCAWIDDDSGRYLAPALLRQTTHHLRLIGPGVGTLRTRADLRTQSGLR
jgi:hypothetical protein